jgi:hypothetical protein
MWPIIRIFNGDKEKDHYRQHFSPDWLYPVAVVLVNDAFVNIPLA